MFKICVIGCGSMARTGHGPAFQKYAASHPDTLLAGCCDLNAEAAAYFQLTFGFEKAYTDYRQMLDDIHPDAVSLLCPVAKTAELAVDVLKRGYNLILEKPPGRNRAEIEAIEQAGMESNVFVRTAFNRRYTPLISKLKELMAGEKIRNITYQMYRKNRRDADFATTSIHAVDAVSFIADSPYKEISFIYDELPECGENVANIYLHGKLQNNAVVSLCLVPMGGTIAERISVNTDKATYFVELPFWNNADSPGKLTRIDGNLVTHCISGDNLVDSEEMFETSGFYEENRGFFQLIRSSVEPFRDLKSGIQSVEIADMIRNRNPYYQEASICQETL